MNKNEIAVKELNKGINIAVQKAISPYENQFSTGIVVSEGNLEGYKIKINSIEYDNILSLEGLSLNAKDTVIVISPNGCINNMFILGRLR